ncbi:hypothetical protein [Chromobacterium violaceum]|uniref:hypothetical protein n=1 Tax=Chromobacterium violaceum TaxID=536 RepID=UPI0012D2D612|nr:hypothetical protein [Chromobacterium violaceum]
MKISITIESSERKAPTPAKIWAIRAALVIALALCTSPLWLLAVALFQGVPA